MSESKQERCPTCKCEPQYPRYASVFSQFKCPDPWHDSPVSTPPVRTCDQQTIIDISNLLFYSQMADQHNWETDCIHKSVIITTLREIAGRLTALNEYAKDLAEAGREVNSAAPLPKIEVSHGAPPGVGLRSWGAAPSAPPQEDIVQPAMNALSLESLKDLRGKIEYRIRELEREAPAAPPQPGREWVQCPICGQSDMRKETDADGNSLIFCVNHACASNGGGNADNLAELKSAHRLWEKDHDELVKLRLGLTDSATEREAFEKWAKDTGNWTTAELFAGWEAWQASARRRER